MLFIIVFVLAIPSFAQDNVDIPLIAAFNDQVYQLEGNALIPYDACLPDEQMFGQLKQSPDGLRFLIVTRPHIIQEALAALGSLGDIPYGVNLWLCDTSTNTVERILAQPNADESFTGDLPTVDYVQSRPAWSPDGTQLAWTQLQLIGEAQSVVIYDVASGVTQEIAIELPAAPFPAPPEITWANEGILLSVFTLDEVTFFNIESLHSFDIESGTITNEVIFYDGGETDDYIGERLFVQNDGQTALALHYFNTGWALLDINTGEQQAISNSPALFNPMFPDSPSLLFDVDADYNYLWKLAGGDVELFAYPGERVALAPDGTGFAYADSVLHIWRDGRVIDVANSDGFADDFRANLLWLPKSWRVGDAEELASASSQIVNCDGAPESRLSSGETAITTINLNVRDNPTTTAEKIGELAPEQEVSVVNGPECANGYAWYFVQSGGLMGWVAEGSAEDYFIAPMNP
jgi:hypothetical protein